MNYSKSVFQNSYVRYKVGAPVMQVVKSIAKKRHQYSTSYRNYKDAQNFSSDNGDCTDSYYTDYEDNNSSIINEPKTSALSSAQLSHPPAYSANTIYGEEMLLPIQGYFCSVCDSFFNTRDKAFQKHCTTKAHYENYIKLYKETIKLENSVDETSSSLDQSNDLITNPLPIKIKIENTDIITNDDNVKKPLSERLGAVKKNNKSKLSKRLKNKIQLCYGDYNKSVLQFLPKPSSHITPSRKVFVDENLNSQSSFGSNVTYSTPTNHNI